MANIYSEYQSEEISEKVILITLEPALRLIGFTLDSGSVYKKAFDEAVIVSLEDSGTALTEVQARADVAAGKFFNDRVNKEIFVQTSDSANPNTKFLAITFRLYFSNAVVRAPNDPSDATSFDVEWLPMVDSISDFGVSLDNRNLSQIGVAVEGKGSISFKNAPAPLDGVSQDPLLVGFWDIRYDKLIWENKKAVVFSWSRDLPITEAKRIYRGIIQSKAWTPTGVTFSLKDQIAELRGRMVLPTIASLATEKVPTSLKNALQRRVYGYVFGHLPTNTDQITNADDTAFLLTGTVSATLDSTALTGAGTSFLSELTPGDEIRITIDEDLVFTIESVASDTSATLSEDFDDISVSGASLFLTDPIHPKRFINRGPWILAEHRLRQPETTVTGFINLNRLRVASVNDLLVGDSVTIGSETTTISQISGLQLKFSTNLVAPPGTGAAVIRNAVEKVRINQDLLQKTRDYTFDHTTEPSTLTLDGLAEFNIASIRVLSAGTVTFDGTRAVTGSGTSFKSDLRVGMDWLRVRGNADFFEILSIESDTALTLRVAATYSDTDTGEYKQPQILDPEEEDQLSCDLLGKTADGTTTGTFLKTVPQIVEDLLKEAGLTSLLDSQSFLDAIDEAGQRVGFVIPAQFTGTRTGIFRDFINELNKSIFGSLIQNEDFDLAYSVLSPKKSPQSLLKLNEADTLGFSIKSLSDRIIKTAIVSYAFKEHNPFSFGPSNLTQSKTSDIGQFLTKTNAEFEINTILVDDADARHQANRWAFLRELSSTLISIQTKLQGARLSPTDPVQFSHQKTFQRFGSSDKVKIGAVQSITKSAKNSSMVLEDLNSAFTRVATITPDTANVFADSSVDERAVNGYITDNDGLIDNSAFGINLIW